MLSCNSTSDADARARLERDATVQDVAHDVHSREPDSSVPDSAVPDIVVVDTTAPDSPPDTADGMRRDAGPSGPFDAAVCALPEETGDPPPDCIAPCMWTVLKSCHLSRCCVFDSAGAYYKKCDRQGVLSISASFGGTYNQIVYAADGSRCYSASAQGVPGGGSTGSVTFSNGKGEPFAVMEWVPSVDGGDVRKVSCAGKVYNVDLAQPKCAPWTNEDCVAGMCPDQP